MILTTLHQLESISSLSAYADGFIVGLEGVSIRAIQNLTETQLKEVKQECEKTNKKLYVNFCKLFMEDELEYAQKGLEGCLNIGIDGIYYADEGLYYLAEKLNMVDRLIYQPETLVTNHLDVQYYLDQGIQSVSLAHELSLEEIENIAKYQNNIEILLHGTYSILYSKRPLVSNYLQAHGIEWKDDYSFDLIEQTREDRMPIVQDDTGTHIFTEAEMKSIDQYQRLQDCGIQRFRIDSYFHDDNWTLQVLKAYQEGLELLDGSDLWYGQETIKKKGDDDE